MFQIVLILGIISSVLSSNLDIRCTAAGYFPHPSDCTKFFRCVDWFGNGRRISIFHFDCPYGTLYDQNLFICNHAEWIRPPPKCAGGQLVVPSPVNQLTSPDVVTANTNQGSLTPAENMQETTTKRASTSASNGGSTQAVDVPRDTEVSSSSIVNAVTENIVAPTPDAGGSDSEKGSSNETPVAVTTAVPDAVEPASGAQSVTSIPIAFTPASNGEGSTHALEVTRDTEVSSSSISNAVTESIAPPTPVAGGSDSEKGSSNETLVAVTTPAPDAIEPALGAQSVTSIPIPFETSPTSPEASSISGELAPDFSSTKAPSPSVEGWAVASSSLSPVAPETDSNEVSTSASNSVISSEASILKPGQTQNPVEPELLVVVSELPTPNVTSPSTNETWIITFPGLPSSVPSIEQPVPLSTNVSEPELANTSETLKPIVPIEAPSKPGPPSPVAVSELPTPDSTSASATKPEDQPIIFPGLPPSVPSAEQPAPLVPSISESELANTPGPSKPVVSTEAPSTPTAVTTSAPTQKPSVPSTQNGGRPSNSSAVEFSPGEIQNIFQLNCGSKEFLRLPTACDRFYKCYWIASESRLGIDLFQCDRGLIFDDVRKKCDKAENVECPLKSSSIYTVAPGSLYKCREPGHFPHELDCVRFYRCFEVKPGELKGLLYRCPEKYGFSETSQRCEKVAKLPECPKPSFKSSKPIYEIDLEDTTVVREKDLDRFFKTKGFFIP